MEIKDLPYLTNLLQLVAALAATVHYGKYKFSDESYFLQFLWFTFVVDLIGAFVGDVLEINGNWIYNTFMFFSFLFYFYWYYRIFKNKLFKTLVVLFAISFVTVAIAHWLLPGWESFHMYTYLTGAVLLFMSTLLHFYELLYKEELFVIKHKLGFWISTGLLLFYIGLIPLTIFRGGLNTEGLAYNLLLVGLNLILYGCYTIGFLWLKKKE